MNVLFENSGHPWERAPLLSLIALLHIGALWALTSGSSASPSQQPAKVVSAFMVQAAPAVVETPPTPVQPVPKPPTPQPKPKPKPKPTPKPKPRVEPEPPVKPTVTAPVEEPISTPQPVVTPPPSSAPSIGEAPVTTAPPPAQPKTITSGVEYISMPAPKYPALSRRMGEEGKVVLRVLIDDRGRAGRIEVHQSSGSERLDQAAREAVQRARFKPYIENGRAIAVFAIVPIAFKLEN